ncbi:hypothetical protein BD289DRAFT_413009 [Coniella lustricola]|uniref:Signal recognition particle subunit SRP72 n=1 Tax=Coniella lustricola TaxID=2025994 RepID=A0A2T3A267_9PEZI|nr:hypothetical protein BD289DRAFT_413009 [Coniella lustricola]
MASKLTTLLARSSIEDHSEALAAADAALAADSKSLPAQHTKVIAMLRLERYDDALRIIAAGGDALESQCVLGKSYALYKTGALQDASELLSKYVSSSDNPDDRALRHIAAQVAYRVERFDEALSLYESLLEDESGRGSSNVDEATDLKINLLAAHAQLEWQGKGDLVPDKSKQPSREDLEAFETAYNAGCGCLARGDLAKASVLLKRAADLCETAEDLSEEDKKAELLPIVLQQAYVLALLGKDAEAAALQKSVENYENSDDAINAVGQWNGLISKSLTNPFMIQRLAELIPEANTGNARLFNHQAVGVIRNQAAVDLLSYKRSAVKNRSAHILKADATPSIDLERVTWGYLNAAAKAHLTTSAQPSIRSVVALLETRPYDVGLLLTVIQLYVHTKHYDSAIDVLHKFFKYLQEEAGEEQYQDVRFAPGLVSLAVALYRTQNRKKDIREELARAVSYWQSVVPPPSTNTSKSTLPSRSLLRDGGIELIRSAKAADLAAAGAAFERLVAQDPDDAVAQAGLIASYATTDYSKIEAHLDSLSPIESLTGDVDVAALLDAGVPAFPAPQHHTAGGSKKRKAAGGEEESEEADVKQQTQQQQQLEKSSSKKKKRTRRGKTYDPNVKPDPERWLPLRDRSNYRPKNKKGKKKAADSTQGGFVSTPTGTGTPVTEGEMLNLTGGAGQIKVEKVQQGGGGGGGGGGSGGGGKKKKGRK